MSKVFSHADAIKGFKQMKAQEPALFTANQAEKTLITDLFKVNEYFDQCQEL